MNTYTINKVFANDDDLHAWLKANTERHEDGIRELYNHEVIWAVNCSQQVDVHTMKRGPVTLDNIQTWPNK